MSFCYNKSDKLTRRARPRPPVTEEAAVPFMIGGVQVNSTADVWSKVLSLMEADMTATTIHTWFDDVTAVSLDEETFVLHSPSDFKRDMIRSRYVPIVQKALRELFSSDFKVIVLGTEELEKYRRPSTDGSFLPGTEDKTFEKFVVGSSNKFAHAAALAVAEGRGENYNPLFIYGESGLGKTHLLYAIAHTIHERHPEYRILYIKGDTFTNELVQSLINGQNQEFRDKYRFADVFLMDDVQFIAGKDSSQEEMFHTFNSLYEAGKQIVFTADRPPKEMLQLDDRLRTRFESGLPIDIQPPDYETRLAIIKNKVVRQGLNLPDPILQYIAENVTSNVRQLEGTINRLAALQNVLGEETITEETLQRTIDMLTSPRSEFLPSPEIIIQEVAKYYGLDPHDLREQDRSKTTALARQVAMYEIRRICGLSLDDIGHEFSDRDHSTVLYSIRRIEKLIRTDSEMAEIIKDINANINARYD